MKQRILFVDDDPQIREVLTLYLDQNNFTIRCVRTSDEAMRILDQMPFDLVILDVFLDGEDGLQLLELLKMNHPGKPFIVYTGRAFTQDTILEAKARGAYACLSKVAPLDTLLSMIRSALTYSG